MRTALPTRADLAAAIQDRLRTFTGYYLDYDYADSDDLKGLQDTLIDLGLEVAALRTTIERAG